MSRVKACWITAANTHIVKGKLIIVEWGGQYQTGSFTSNGFFLVPSLAWVNIGAQSNSPFTSIWSQTHYHRVGRWACQPLGCLGWLDLLSSRRITQIITDNHTVNHTNNDTVNHTESHIITDNHADKYKFSHRITHNDIDSHWITHNHT